MIQNERSINIPAASQRSLEGAILCPLIPARVPLDRATSDRIAQRHLGIPFALRKEGTVLLPAADRCEATPKRRMGIGRWPAALDDHFTDPGLPPGIGGRARQVDVRAALRDTAKKR